MAGPTKQDKVEAQGAAGRRSTRLFISIPIAISGKDTAGHTFKENTKTLIINKHGAKVATVHQVALGAELGIENRALGRSAKACVVWLGDKASPKDASEIGLQLTEAQNIWGIEFPPDDWQEGPPVGPGGQRLERSAAKAPPKGTEAPAAPQAKAPALAPSPSVASPQSAKTMEIKLPIPGLAAPVAAPSPGASSAALEAATARFAQRADEAAQASLKCFEEHLARVTNQFGFRTQASLQEAANRLEEKTVAALEQRLSGLESRLGATRDELETQLARFKELKQNAPAEVEKTRHNIETASQQALQAALKSLEGRARHELDALSSGFVQETRQRVKDEASKVMEDFSKEASRRFAALTQDFISKAAPELEARRRQMTDQAHARMNEELAAATGQARETIRKMGNEIASSVRADIESSLASHTGELLARLTQTFEEQTQASAQAADQSLQRSLKDVKAAIQQEIANAAAKVRESYQQEAEKANKAVSEQTAKSIEQSFKSEADAYRHKLTELSDSALESYQSKADTLNETFSARLQKTLQNSQDKGAKEVTDKLQKTADDLLDSLARQLGKHGEETVDLLSAELKTEGEELVADTEKQLRAAIQAGLNSLTLEVQTTSTEYRDHLHKTYEEFEGRTARELPALLRETADKQREAILEQLQTGIDDSINKSLAQVKKLIDGAVGDATGTVNKQVGAAAVALKDWEDQARDRLGGHAQASLEKLRKDANALVDDLPSRLEKAAHVFQDRGMEEIHARLKAATEALVEASAAQLRKHADENVELAAQQLRERQAQAVGQAEDLFRNTLADMLRAVIQPKASQATDRESSPSETTKKGM